MKQLLSILLAALLLLSLTACGTLDKAGDALAHKIVDSLLPGEDGQRPALDPAAAEKGTELAKELGLTDSGWLAVDNETAPYGQYRTVEEWEAIFNGEDDYDNAPAPVEAEPPAPVAIEGAEGGYSGGAKTITFDETQLGEDTGVEIWDWKSEMTPEELAEYEEFENTDWQAMMSESGVEASEPEGTGGADIGMGETPDIDTDDLQQQIDQAMEDARKQLEEMGLGDLFPEGTGPLLP